MGQALFYFLTLTGEGILRMPRWTDCHTSLRAGSQ